MAQFTPEIERYSNLYGVDANIVRAIIQQESNWNIYSIRYEPGWSYLSETGRFAKLNNITESTETELQKFSYGLGQIMGSVYRELGFGANFMTLFSAEIQISYLCKYVKKISVFTRNPQELFACYNGGHGALLKEKDGKFLNQGYVDSAMGHLNAYRSMNA